MNLGKDTPPLFFNNSKGAKRSSRYAQSAVPKPRVPASNPEKISIKIQNQSIGFATADNKSHDDSVSEDVTWKQNKTIDAKFNHEDSLEPLTPTDHVLLNTVSKGKFIKFVYVFIERKRSSKRQNKRSSKLKKEKRGNRKSGYSKIEVEYVINDITK